MDQRLLARLKDHAATPAPSWHPVLTFAPPVAALLTAALLLMVFHHAQRPTAPATIQTTAQAAPEANQATPQRIQSPVVLPASHTSVPILSPSTASQPATAAEIDPAYLPSFPAPEAPLTADERRLLRAAQHAPTYDVAQLEALPEPLARRQGAVAQYIHHMLAPLITAESFSPTPAVEHDPPPLTQPEAQSESQPDSNSSPQ
jgi:hypothetical protein